MEDYIEREKERVRGRGNFVYPAYNANAGGPGFPRLILRAGARARPRKNEKTEYDNVSGFPCLSVCMCITCAREWLVCGEPLRYDKIIFFTSLGL